VSIVDILSLERVAVSLPGEDKHVRNKEQALRRLAELLAQPGVSAERIFEVLEARERLQSTGVGGGVAVPHGAVEELTEQVGAFLVCREPIGFDAIDGEPVTILFALVGPKGAPAQHLKVLARVSRLLRNAGFRSELGAADSGETVYRMIAQRDGAS